MGVCSGHSTDKFPQEHSILSSVIGVHCCSPLFSVGLQFGHLVVRYGSKMGLKFTTCLAPE